MGALRASRWPDNASFLNLVAWCLRHGERRYLIVVNLSDNRSQATARAPWEALRGRRWRLDEALGGGSYDRSGDDLCGLGIFVDLEPWAWHFFRLEPE